MANLHRRIGRYPKELAHRDLGRQDNPNTFLAVDRGLAAQSLQALQIRAAVVALPPTHPFLRAAIQFATSLRQRIIEGGLLTEQELDEAIEACEVSAQDPGTCGISFVVTQVWGWKPRT